MQLISTFKDRLIEALESSGTTSTELANAIGLSKQAISSYITGVRQPKRPVIEAISERLNVSPAWLMGYDVEKRLKKPTIKIDDELLNALHSDETRLMLAHWIAAMNKDQLEMVVKLLDAARLAPKE